jgi:hypothetical protein
MQIYACGTVPVNNFPLKVVEEYLNIQIYFGAFTDYAE